MIKNIGLVDRIKVPSERKLTDAGQMHVPCKFARTGSQLYTAKQLGLVDREENEVVEVHREACDVFDEVSMNTFRSAPVTIGHPKNEAGEAIVVTAANAKKIQVGMLEGMPVQDEDTLGGTLILTAQEAIDALEDGTQELSAGYTCDIEDVDGKYFQRNIRANHIAIVSKGRAGSSCRISDEALEIQEAGLEDGAIEAKVAQAKAEKLEQEKKEAKEAADKAKRKANAEAAKEAEEAAKKAAEELAAKPKTKKEKAAAAKEAALVEKAEAVEAQEKAAKEAAEAVAAEELAAKLEAEAAEEVVSRDEAIDLTDELAVQVKLVDELTAELESIKVELADAKEAANQSVTDRCAAIENARLISDFRDLGDKTIEQIERMVVEDQMPEKDLSGKSDTYISAMFEILVDASQGETPMGRLLKKADLGDVAVAKPVNKVAAARKAAIERSKKR